MASIKLLATPTPCMAAFAAMWAERVWGLSLFFDDLLDSKVREFNPRYGDAEGSLPGRFRHLNADIYGTGQPRVRRVPAHDGSVQVAKSGEIFN